MARSLWSIAVAGLGLGSFAMVGGTVVGGDLGPLVAGYGALVVLAAMYMAVGLALRDRAWRRLGRPVDPRRIPTAGRLAGRRVF